MENSGVTPAHEAVRVDVLEALAVELAALRENILAGESEFAPWLERLHPMHAMSGRNLVHYLTLRRHDIRDLQQRLAQVGLSSLGRTEAHVQTILDRMLVLLALARGLPSPRFDALPPIGFRHGERQLADNATALLGPSRSNRAVRIIVTLPDEAATDAKLVRAMVAAGMDGARINCAHGDESVWGAMIDNVRRAARDTGIACRILMDLGGPKLRTDRLRGDVEHIRLFKGDRLLLVRPEVLDQTAEDENLPVVSCAVPEVFRDVAAGQAIWFDDGKLGGVVDAVRASGLLVRLTHARPKGVKLRAGKGINLPDTALALPALTTKDLSDLDFVARHAHAVGLSFVQCEDDVDALREALAQRRAAQLGIMLKIETRAAFAALPRLLLAAMRARSCGVMIARGDLAVECGYERLAEVQEEILWIAEAAHVPVIWATQVLENLARKGVPSRAEVTDAAMSGRAEAVMLNKGEYVIDAIRALDDILVRMQAHQTKKRSLLRPLHVSVPSGNGADGNLPVRRYTGSRAQAPLR
jgi:pyruvate kinase